MDGRSWASDVLDEHLQTSHRLRLGSRVLVHLARCMRDDGVVGGELIELRGRHLDDGVPRSVQLTVGELRAVLG
jgi:hypothetical protein